MFRSASKLLRALEPNAPRCGMAWVELLFLIPLSCTSPLPAGYSISLTFLPPSFPAVFTPQWYASVLARMHLNAFRVLPMAPAVALTVASAPPGQWSAAMWQAASSAVSGEEGFGSGLYLLPSMFNHDCGECGGARMSVGMRGIHHMS